MGSGFVTTQWSQVIAARDGSGTHGSRALAALCETYWYPLYAFVRRQGTAPDEAQDLTQSYFAELLDKGFLDSVEPDAGRFRSFLLASMRHFLTHQWERARALKRGGSSRKVSLDTAAAEDRYVAEPMDGLTPEQVFERRWALTVLEATMERLRHQAQAANEERRFERLNVFLTGQKPNAPYREVAAELSMSEVAVRGAVHRLRKRFGEALRAEIAETVANPDDVDDEIRHLLMVVEPWEARQA